jgi:hypothetical protein
LGNYPESTDTGIGNSTHKEKNNTHKGIMQEEIGGRKNKD